MYEAYQNLDPLYNEILPSGLSKEFKKYIYILQMFIFDS